MSKTKIRILAIERILNYEWQTVDTILDRLQDEYDIISDRRTVMQDIKILRLYLDIETGRGYRRKRRPQ